MTMVTMVTMSNAHAEGVPMRSDDHLARAHAVKAGYLFTFVVVVHLTIPVSELPPALLGVVHGVGLAAWVFAILSLWRAVDYLENNE